MTRGMGSISVWMSAALVLASGLAFGCGGSAANQNRGRVSNPNAAVMPVEEVFLRYAPTPGLTMQRTTRMSAMMEGRSLEMETVMRETLGPRRADTTSRCLHASISFNGEQIEVPCGSETGGAPMMQGMIGRFETLSSSAVIEYPNRPVRVGESWPCEGSPIEQCRWTLTGIEDSPSGRVALLRVDGAGDVEGQTIRGHMVFTARVSDGVLLRAEFDGEVPGQLSFHVSISAVEMRATN